MATNQNRLHEEAEFNRLKRVIQEELGISNEVKFLANSLVNKIIKDYRPGYTIRVTPFSEDCGEYEISVNLKDYPKKSMAISDGNDYRGVTYHSYRLIQIVGYSVNGKIPADSLAGTLQHELKHVFDLYKSKREGFFKTQGDINIYHKAALQAMDKTLPIEYRNIGYAVYLSHDFESQAFESGTYAFLMRQNLSFIGDEVEAVKESPYYKRLLFARDAYDFINENEERAKEIAESVYGKSLKWLKRTVSAALKTTRRQIGRAVAKVRKDYDWTHGGDNSVWV